MNDNDFSLDAAWDQLIKEAAESTVNGIFSRRIHPNSACDLFLGVEKPAYKKLFLIKAQKTVLELAKNLPESKGVRISIVALPDEKSGQDSLILSLKEDKFYDVFISLVNDITQHLIPITDEEKTVKTLILRLKKWQAFMEQYTEKLGEEIIQGLFGELYFISDVIISKNNIQGIKSWKGYQNTNQDFYFPNAVFEVKTSLGREPKSLRISSERQLDKNGYPNLLIYHVSLERAEEEGKSLPELIDEIRIKIRSNHDILDLFEDALFSLGYIDAQRDNYNQRFFVRNTEFYEVTDSFPKITEKMLPNGLGDVQYGINVSECRHYIVEENKVLKLIKHE